MDKCLRSHLLSLTDDQIQQRIDSLDEIAREYPCGLAGPLVKKRIEFVTELMERRRRRLAS